ncbi:hypothetical protein [Nostoc sp. 'Peltigera membranacea cyanobiont' 213]|uniref:hypothetical protein n=1 Tax=Nostoc sp. 'Peltigera membranacea cyanobiont' 213 TaxID=2014530 RepID=UPI000B952803|nr:hypothetical protein [Nostoc sp. 'Peltigera membranacea cyanobiont' 213]
MPRRTNDMRKHIITELSDEQEAMLPFYRDKWRSIQISTESIQQEKVAEVIAIALVSCLLMQKICSMLKGSLLLNLLMAIVSMLATEDIPLKNIVSDIMRNKILISCKCTA